MSVRETSLEAYRALELQAQERELMLVCHRHFHEKQFTRSDLEKVTGWKNGTIAGRVNGLIKKGYLTEYDQTRGGGHLLSIAQQKATSQPSTATVGTAPSAKGVGQGGVADVAPIESIDRKGRTLRYTAEGFGPGYPAW